MQQNPTLTRHFNNAQKLPYEESRSLLLKNLRGEMTVQEPERRFSLKDGGFVQSVASVLSAK